MVSIFICRTVSFVDSPNFCSGSAARNYKNNIYLGIVVRKTFSCHVPKKYSYICPDHRAKAKIGPTTFFSCTDNIVNFLNECVQISGYLVL